MSPQVRFVLWSALYGFLFWEQLNRMIEFEACLPHWRALVAPLGVSFSHIFILGIVVGVGLLHLFTLHETLPVGSWIKNPIPWDLWWIEVLGSNQWSGSTGVTVTLLFGLFKSYLYLCQNNHSTTSLGYSWSRARYFTWYFPLPYSQV